MFPKWAVGFSNSEFAEMDEARCLANVNGYRSRGIPIDLYTFDFQWKAWGDDNYGEWRWNPVNFPDGPSGGFKARMAALGMKMAGIMKPRIHVDSAEGRYATAHGFWVPGRHPYADYFSHKLVNDLDFSNPDAGSGSGAHAVGAFDTGIVGWWNDEADAWGDTWEFMDMQRALYEGQREHTLNQVRVWSNNRNFYSGAQRYAYATWSGDIESGFQGDAAAAGEAPVLAQRGPGSAGDGHRRLQQRRPHRGRGVQRELRALDGVRRLCADLPHPWDVVQAAVALRPQGRGRGKEGGPTPVFTYSLPVPLRPPAQPDRGRPLPPLVWDYPDDPECLNYVDAWMFGDFLLVAPVVDRGQAMKRIHLPAASGSTISAAAAWRGRYDRLSGGPLHLARHSALHPKGRDPPLDRRHELCGRETRDQGLCRRVSRRFAGLFSYYDDDGGTYDYEKGVFFEQGITAQDRGATVTVDISDQTGHYGPALRRYVFKVHGGAAAGVPSTAADGRLFRL